MRATSSLHSLESNIPLDAIINILSSFRTFQYGYFAGLTLLVYDTIITVDQEMRFFPITHFNPVTFAFVLVCVSSHLTDIYFLLDLLSEIRCCGIFRAAISTLPSNLHNSVMTCNLVKWANNLADWLILMCIDYVLCIRIRAFYSLSSKDKKIAKVIQALFFVEGAITFGTVLYSIITTQFDYIDLSGLRPCITLTAPGSWTVYLSWGTLLLYQVITLALSVAKTVSLQRSLGNRGVRLTKLVLHDQLTYVIIAVVIGIVHLVGFNVSDSSQDVPLVAEVIIDLIGSPGMLSLVGAWMILRLKRAGEESPREGSLKIPTLPSTDAIGTANTGRNDGRESAAHSQA